MITETAKQVQRLAEDGYVVIPDAMDAGQVARLTAALDRVSGNPEPAPGDGDVQLFGLPDLDPDLLEPVALKSTLAVVCAALGWNIFMYHSHLDVNPPAPGHAPFAYYWHQDMASATQGLPPPTPLLSLKVAYFLTDVTSPDRGSLRVIPGSHLRDSVNLPEDPAQESPEAVPVLVPAGSAVIMDPRIRHARGPNHSGLTRKALFYAYAYRWIRPRDEIALDDARLARLSPALRQLLGAGTGLEGFHRPQDADVPLREIMAEQPQPGR
ncbi:MULTISPECIES: phytanoyl-CoA dioxygenase family protein [unclassified Streptomyces]|uniref:phytanoyl-CoA dioxygenase family protein n=1 Tax=unclassified Streptomyces TaxID=2593676 RepID=UPI0013142D8B|nr:MULTISPECIES: phytanoyl-CoA dioxygenase family protein [unclassified Streptomyces]